MYVLYHLGIINNYQEKYNGNIDLAPSHGRLVTNGTDIAVIIAHIHTEARYIRARDN